MGPHGHTGSKTGIGAPDDRLVSSFVVGNTVVNSLNVWHKVVLARWKPR